MRLPGFTAAVALDGSRRRYYQAVTGTVAGSQGVVLPANVPSAGKGGVVVGVVGNQCPVGVCPANPAVCAPMGACPSDGVFDCDYAKARCDCYGETDPSGCCDYWDGHCIPSPPGFAGGNGSGGEVGGPHHHGPVQV
jgi:hypothetical protein